MVIVTGRFELAPEDRAAFIASKEDGMRSSRAEDGCITYVFAADPIEPGLVHLYERWASRAALDAHIAGMRSRGTPAPSPVPVLNAELLVGDVSGIRPFG